MADKTSRRFSKSRKDSISAPQTNPEPLAENKIRSFKITNLDAEAKKIEVKLA
jgi:hypothetical protein